MSWLFGKGGGKPSQTDEDTKNLISDEFDDFSVFDYDSEGESTLRNRKTDGCKVATPPMHAEHYKEHYKEHSDEDSEEQSAKPVLGNFKPVEIELSEIASQTVIQKDDEKYIGMMKGGMKEGDGIMYKGEFKVYEGKWKNDFYEGEGKEYNEMGILIRKGIFINGLLLTGTHYVLRENGVTVNEIDNCDEINHKDFYGDDFVEILDIIMEQLTKIDEKKKPASLGEVDSDLSLLEL